MAILIKANGGIEQVGPKNGQHFSLQELQSFVGDALVTSLKETGE